MHWLACRSSAAPARAGCLAPTGRFGPGVFLVSTVLAVVLAAHARAESADAADDSPATFSVAQTFDKTPFSYRMELLSRKTGYRIYRLTYPSPVVTPVEQNNTVPADYYLPEGIGPNDPKRPAVICIHILEGNFELVHMTCSVLASRGIPAIMFKLPYYGERSPPGGRRALAANPKLFVGALSQSFQDVRRTIDLLASRPEIDPQRIGITGISLGGIVAASAAGAEPRLSRAALILAGGDLPYIIHHARETRILSQTIRRLPAEQRTALEKSIDAVDPLRHAAGLRDRARRGKVLMINAAQDEVIAPQCTEKLATALGIADRVVWLEGLGHYTAMAALPKALKTTADFFAEDLPPGVKPAEAAVAKATAVRVVVSLLQQAGRHLGSEPQPGRCHFVDLEGTATLPDGKQVDAKFRFVRGTKHRFSLRCKLPEVGEVALGQGAYPWIAAGEKAVFQGTLAPDAEPGNPLAYADPQHVMKLKMLSGAVGALVLVPDVLERWAAIEDGTSSDGDRVVLIASKRNARDRAELVFNEDGKTPQRLTFHVSGVRGTVTFRAWQLNTVAHDALFEEPATPPRQQVDAVDLYRIFSAMFNFAMENVQ